MIEARITAVFAEYQQEVSHGKVFYTGTANNCSRSAQICNAVSINAFGWLISIAVHRFVGIHFLLCFTARRTWTGKH